jgi:ATP-binding cassette, subfamily B, bacterial
VTPLPPSSDRVWLSSRKLYQEFREFFRSGRSVEDEVKEKDEAESDEAAALRANRKGYLREYLKFISQWKGAVLFILALALISTAMDSLIPFVSGQFIDRVFGTGTGPTDGAGRMLFAFLSGQDTPDMTLEVKHRLCGAFGALLLGLAFVSNVIGSFRDYWTHRLNTKVISRLKLRLYEHLLRLPMARVHQLKTGRIVSRLTGDVEAVTGLMQMALVSPVVSLLRLVLALGVVFYWNHRIALVLLATLIPVALLSAVWVKPLRRLWQYYYKRKSAVDGRLTETFGGLRVVRAFQQEVSEARRQTAGNHSLHRINLFGVRLSAVTHVFWNFLIPAAGAVILWYGGHLVIRGEATIGQLLGFIGYTQMLLWPVYNIISTMNDLQKSFASMDRVFAVLAEPTEVDDAPEADDAPKQIDELAFEHLDFAYGPEKKVISNFCLRVPAGATVAFVGPSGSGKTTLTDLIARFYTPSGGRISVNGRDIRDFRLHSWRRHFGMVQQDVFLFDGTIADNIAFAEKGATREQIEAAAKAANAHDFIAALPQGYDSLIGERGTKLSGGQRQRLSIARAILADPPILILDEATSALDSESEKLIQDALERFQQDRMTFVIAHRLSTIAKADLIVVLEKGQLVESGTHTALMEKDGAYAAMVRRQRDAFSQG